MPSSRKFIITDDLGDGFACDGAGKLTFQVPPDHQLFDTGAGTPNDLSLDPANGQEAIEVDRSDPANPCVVANWHWDATTSKWLENCIDPLPTASLFVAPGQPCEAVQVNLGYAKSPECALPGGQTAGPWVLKNGLGFTIASGDDLEGTITLPNLCGETLPFTFEYQVTDACGTSFPAESFGFQPVAALPTATVLVDPNQWCGGVGITLGYAANPSCPTPGQTAGSWVIKDNLGATVASGTDLAGALPPQDLCAETGPFTLEATVTDACGTSATVIEPFATVPALPTAGVTVPAGQECDTATADFTHTADPACPVGTQTAGSYVIKDSGGNTVFGPTAQLAGTGITLPDLCAYADPQETLTIEYTTTDSCGTSSAPATANFVVDPVAASITVPILLGDGTCELDSPSTCPAALCDIKGTPIIIDNGDPGYSSVSFANTTFGDDYNNNSQYNLNSSGLATWEFASLPVGTYEVAVRWTVNATRANNAPYTIYDDATLVSSVVVDQTVFPVADYTENDDNNDARDFEIIESGVSITSGTLKVQLSASVFTGSNYVIADAVRIVQADLKDPDFYVYNGTTYTDLSLFEQAIINYIPNNTSTASIYCQNGELVADVDGTFNGDAVHTDPLNPTADPTINPNQDPYDVQVNLGYIANAGCPSPGINSAQWRLLYADSSPTGLSGTDLPGTISINTNDYVNNGDIFNAVYPADFNLKFEYTVFDDCGQGTTVIDFTVNAILKDFYTYTGVTETLQAPVWATNVEVKAWGAGGGALSFQGGTDGGSGGYVSGTFPPSSINGYTVAAGEGGRAYLGQTGNTPFTVVPGGDCAGTAFKGGDGYVGINGGGTVGDGAGSGGGFTGLFNGAVTAVNAFMIAGGGGGLTDGGPLNGGSGGDGTSGGGVSGMSGDNGVDLNGDLNWGSGGGGAGLVGGTGGNGDDFTPVAFKAEGGTSSSPQTVLFSPTHDPPNVLDPDYIFANTPTPLGLGMNQIGVSGTLSPFPTFTINKSGGDGLMVVTWTT